MNYEVIKVEEKVVVGKNVDTTYADNQCYNDLPKVWNDFLEGGIYQKVNNKTNQKPMGIYYNQKLNEGVVDFSFMTCCEVTEYDNDDLDMLTIPASNYAKFTFKGQTPEAVNTAWESIAKLDLNKNTGYDFEVYSMDAQNPEDRTLECFVSIK